MAASSTFLKGMRDTLKILSRASGFDRHLAGVELVEGSPGRCLVSFKVKEGDLNMGGTMHGGLGATIVDVVSTVALCDKETGYLLVPGVTTDMAITYMAAAKPGEELLIDGRVLRAGRVMAFLECEIRKKESDVIVLKGSHTKFVGSKGFNAGASVLSKDRDRKEES